MIDFIKSQNNYDNCLNLLDILREKRKLFLGNPQSGEYIIIEYNREGTNPESQSSTQPSTSSESVNDSHLPSNLTGNGETQSNSILLGESESSPRVFISYSHDSNEHKELVSKLSYVLRRLGMDCKLDQYEEQKRAMGWSQWMTQQVEQAKFVLVICTKKYKERFDGNKGGVGLEAKIIGKKLYDGENPDKFISVIFSQEDFRHIPSPLYGRNNYVLNINKLEELYSDIQKYKLETISEKLENNSEYEQYKKLYCELSEQHLCEKPELGKVLKFALNNRYIAVL